ncbi:MAG: amidohydrolase [Lysobacteraceae bacterium]|nr:MAG: amidohydrolase [Xanthomonadaceae bacterium]
MPLLRLTIALFFFINVVPATAATTVIEAAGYVDVGSGILIKPAVIVVEGENIVEINPTQLPKNATRIDLGGNVLLPGLMDMHVHLDLNWDAVNFDVIFMESGAKGALRAAMNAAATLNAGFTTVRNVGQIHNTADMVDVALAEAIEEGFVPGPRVIPAGHMISILGGHGDLGMAHGMAEGMLVLPPERGVVSGAADALRAVRYQIKHGAKVIKIHATAGVLSLEDAVGAQQLTDEEMRVIVEEARRHNLPVAAHAHGTEGIKAAIRAGVDSIEHGSILDDEAIALMQEHNVTFVPTVGLMDRIDLGALPPKKRAKAKYVDPLARESVRRAARAGVRIAMGTDAPLIPHGDNADEIVTLTTLGLSNAEALRTVTINPAVLIRRDDLGQIKPGMKADLIAVGADPLEDINTLRDVRFVMKNGKVVRQP